MLTLEQFKKVIENINKNDDDIAKLEKLGINVIECGLVNNNNESQEILLSDIFGKEGCETIMWWLYDAPSSDRGKDCMWDENKNPIPMKTVEDLYNYLISTVKN